MNRLAVGVLIVSLALAACTPGLSPVSPQNAQATSVALAGTVAAQTVVALPTLTLPPTDTAAPTATSTATSSPAPSPTNTAESPTATAPVTGTLSSPTATVTGTISSPTSTQTGTPPSPTATVTGARSTVTPTDDMVPRFYGTQPPYIPYGRVRLINQAKAQVYISFQCTTNPGGYHVIVEYPVSGTITVSVPAGRCLYVAWVGGREFSAEFGLSRFEELTFTFKKDSITIK